MSARVVVKEHVLVRGPDHRVTHVVTTETHYEPEPPDEPIYLTEEEMGDPDVRRMVEDDAPITEADLDDDDPESYPGPAEED